jgi:hypothetical protein
MGSWSNLPQDVAQPPFEMIRRQREALTTGREPAPATADAVTRILARYELPLRLMEEASARPYEGTRGGAIQASYSFTGLVPAGRIAGARTLDLVSRGEAQAAVDSLVARTRFLRVYDDEPQLFGATVKAREVQGIADDVAIVLSRPAPSDVGLAPLEQALAAVYASDEIAVVMTAEVRLRYRSLDSIWNGRRIGTGLRGVIARPVLRHLTVDLMRTAGDALSAARLPAPDRLQAIDRLEDRRSPILERLDVGGLGVRVAEPFKMISIAATAGMAAARVARLAVAVEQYRRARGALPERLQDLSLQGETTEAHLDPFSGEPLKYIRHDDGYTIYSVGRDVRDDGGQLIADPPPGPAPGTVPPPDIGVRVRDDPA